MNIIWFYNGMTETYRAKVEINGVYALIQGTFICALGRKCDLWVDFTLFESFNSKEEAMAKGQQIISDLYIHETGFFKWKVMVSPFPRPRKTTHDIVGWKKARMFGENDSFEDVIVKLKIPKGTRCNLTTYKCRAEKAIVVAAYRFNPFFDAIGQPINPEARIYSAFAVMDYIRWVGVDFESAIEALDEGKGAPGSVYKVGDTLTVVDFDDVSNESCASGIHFFRDRRRAISYRL